MLDWIARGIVALVAVVVVALVAVFTVISWPLVPAAFAAVAIGALVGWALQRTFV